MPNAPDEVRRWLSEISQRRKVKRGGRKQTKPTDDLKAKAKREYMRAYRKKKKAECNITDICPNCRADDEELLPKLSPSAQAEIEKVLCHCGHTKDEHKSLDSRPFGKWNCTYCQCKEFSNE